MGPFRDSLPADPMVQAKRLNHGPIGERSKFRPSILASPNNACSSGSENPLARTGDKEITPQLGGVFIFDAKPMYPIYNQPNSV
jgi:hypothetical protein